jgi:hypothetical protein
MIDWMASAFRTWKLGYESVCVVVDDLPNRTRPTMMGYPDVSSAFQR